MKEKNFKVGDKVRCITNVDGNNLVKNKVGTIKHVTGKNCAVEFDKNIDGHDCCGKCKDGHGWRVPNNNLELVQKESIVIYQKDNEVIAVNKLTGKKGVAKCSPDDTFDFNTGAKLAFDRLMAFDNVTFEILCVKSYRGFITKGKIYKFINGRTTWDDGHKSRKYENFKLFIHINDYFKDNCVELKVGDDPEEILKKYDKISVGDNVKVIKIGQTYSSYRTWKGLRRYESHYVNGRLPESGKTYKVLNIEQHGMLNDEVALIQDTDTTQVFIIHINGIEKC